ncbi:MAG: cyclic nucleotide-binding/CBS domain-containing protein [Nitrososphaerales archaeon]
MSDQWESVAKWTHFKTEVSDQLTIRRVVEIMVQRNIGSVIVSSSDGELGMLTERDIMSKVIVKGLDPNKTLVGDVATKPLVTIDEDATIWKAAELMSKHHIRRLPVTNRDGEITGLLTTRSISDALPVISRFIESRELLSYLRRMKHQE